MKASIRRADGAICYLNGNEVVRQNIALTAPISGATVASTAISGAATVAYYDFTIPVRFVVDGKNVMSCSVHGVRADTHLPMCLADCLFVCLFVCFTLQRTVTQTHTDTYKYTHKKTTSSDLGSALPLCTQYTSYAA